MCRVLLDKAWLPPGDSGHGGEGPAEGTWLPTGDSGHGGEGPAEGTCWFHGLPYLQSFSQRRCSVNSCWGKKNRIKKVIHLRIVE